SQPRLTNAALATQDAYRRGPWNLLPGYDQNDRTFTATPTYVGRFHHAETFMQHNFTEHLQLLGGASYQHIYMQDDAASVKNPNVTIFSPYLSLFLRNLKGISAELGGRLNQHSAYGTNLTWSFNPSWQASRSLKVFFNAGSGFKAPTLNQLYGQYGPNPDLRPEVSQSLEAGAQFVLPHKGTDIRIAIFQRDIRDVIFFSYDPVTSNALYVNLNRQHDVGLEVETSGKLNPWITWRASYAYVDGQITDRSGSKDSTYHNLYRRPKHTVGLYLGYQMTKTFFVSGNLKTFSKRSDLYFNLSNFKTENVTLDAYALLDVYIEYKPGKERWKLFIDAKNVLNQDYMEVYGYNAMRFNWMAGINVGF
ncbi:MAG: TonB-dependent receptor, partial [Bacteroidetes bacterium]|nr:TonB-dependent receptor [Bacteroidota bacterium]